MALSRSIKTKVGRFVDAYMKRYLGLKAQGASAEGAIKEIYLSYRDQVDRNWNRMKLEDQIMRWSNLVFSDQISMLDPSDVEEQKIVQGLLSSMRIVCPEEEGYPSDCIEYAMQYLVRKYNICGSIELSELPEMTG